MPRLAHLDRRKVDRDVEIGPAHRVGKRAAQNESRRAASIRPVCSAIGTNTPGGIGPRVGWFQRSSASTPHDASCPSTDDDRLVVEMERPVPEGAPQLLLEEPALVQLASIAGAKRPHAPPRPSSWRRAARGRRARIRSSRVAPSAAPARVPTLTPTWIICPFIQNGRDTASWTALVILQAASGSSPSRCMANSSPPKPPQPRPLQAPLLQPLRRPPASSRSPPWWPSASLMSLKSSRSTYAERDDASRACACQGAWSRHSMHARGGWQAGEHVLSTRAPGRAAAVRAVRARSAQPASSVSHTASPSRRMATTPSAMAQRHHDARSGRRAILPANQPMIRP